MEINVTERVQVVKTNPGDEAFLNKIGLVVMAIDGKKFFVQFGPDSGAVFEPHQLKRVG